MISYDISAVVVSRFASGFYRSTGQKTDKHYRPLTSSCLTVGLGTALPSSATNSRSRANRLLLFFFILCAYCPLSLRPVHPRTIITCATRWYRLERTLPTLWLAQILLLVKILFSEIRTIHSTGPSWSVLKLCIPSLILMMVSCHNTLREFQFLWHFCFFHKVALKCLARNRKSDGKDISS